MLCICVRPPAWYAAGADFTLWSVHFELYAKEARFLPGQGTVSTVGGWTVQNSEPAWAPVFDWL